MKTKQLFFVFNDIGFYAIAASLRASRTYFNIYVRQVM